MITDHTHTTIHFVIQEDYCVSRLRESERWEWADMPQRQPFTAFDRALSTYNQIKNKTDKFRRGYRLIKRTTIKHIIEEVLS